MNLNLISLGIFHQCLRYDNMAIFLDLSGFSFAITGSLTGPLGKIFGKLRSLASLLIMLNHKSPLVMNLNRLRIL